MKYYEKQSHISASEFSLYNALTADCYNNNVIIKNRKNHGKKNAVNDRSTFFKKIYSEPKCFSAFDPIKWFSLDQNGTENSNSLEKKEKSVVVFLEGFAGCGKSTFVQYLLWKKELLSDSLESYNCIYNYDLELQFDLLYKEESQSSLFAAIIKSFVIQYKTLAEKNPHVLDEFDRILEELGNNHNRTFYDIYQNIRASNGYKDVINTRHKGKLNKYDLETIENIIYTLCKQKEICGKSTNIFALDFLLRIALYMNGQIDYNQLYVCYDNIDAIEDAGDLEEFDDKIIDFITVFNEYLEWLDDKEFFGDKAMPRFILIVTYRKITASRVNLSRDINREVRNDEKISSANDIVFKFDMSHVFDYTDIIQKRVQFFKDNLSIVLSNENHKSNEIVEQLTKWGYFSDKSNIMRNRYAGIWNHNYRTCSLVASELLSNNSFGFDDCIDFGKKTVVDGEYEIKEENNDIIASSYYGSSAILLNSICKIFNKNGIWGSNNLNLVSLNWKDSFSPNYRNVSLTKLVLTFIYNANNQTGIASLKDLCYTFCIGGNLYSCEELCQCLANLLARNLNGVWRRPIYYSSSATIYSDNNQQIAGELLTQCKRLQNGEKESKIFEFIICDCGKTYVEKILQEFEFYSNRIDQNNKPLFLCTQLDEVKQIVDQVYACVAKCCDNMLELKNEYMKAFGIQKDEQYINLQFNPRTTKTGRPQLHSERTIFSHISYLNQYRLYIRDAQGYQKERYNINKYLVAAIIRYLDLFERKIAPVYADRTIVFKLLKSKASSIYDAINNGSDDDDDLFGSIAN